MAEPVRTVFVSGANRGIGLALVRQFAKESYQAIAGYRDKNHSGPLFDAAEEMGTIFPVQVDVTAEKELEALYGFIAGRFGYLDVLVNNAAVNLNRAGRLGELDWADIAHHFEVNVGGPFLTTRYLYPLIRAGRGKKIVNMSSNLASIERSGRGSVPYRLSKAALNMLSKQQAVEYQAEGVTVISLSPGWVRTDMGGSSAPLSVEEAAVRILRIIDTISPAQSGQFLGIEGEAIPF
jgi:NAD(P)-dependent dehydrogenase (short-subunit alcohol dehydrogenase family)